MKSKPRPTSNARSPDFLDNLMKDCRVIDRDFKYRCLNDAAASHGRSSKQKLSGRSMPDCRPGIQDTAMFANPTICMQERTLRRMENELVFPDGTEEAGGIPRLQFARLCRASRRQAAILRFLWGCADALPAKRREMLDG